MGKISSVSRTSFAWYGDRENGISGSILQTNNKAIFWLTPGKERHSWGEFLCSGGIHSLIDLEAD